MQKERNPFRGVKLFFAGYFALLVLLLTFIGVMNWLGYKMIDISIQFALLGLLVCSALIAGGVWVVKRIQNLGIRILAGILDGVVVVAVAAVLIVLCSMSMFSSMPVHYTSLASPDGKGAVVVLRRLSPDKEAADARRAARAGADSDEYELSDLGYIYTAHPRFAHFFYNSKVQGAGSVEIGCTSTGQLMYEWTGENSLHLYIENPEAQDFGELTLDLN